MGKRNMIIPRVACIVALGVMGICGLAYRTVSNHLQVSVATPISLPIPLRLFPMAVGSWVGKEVPLDENVLRVARNDDFCNRQYVNTRSNDWINLYIAYSGRPRTIQGHRPDVCYVGAGWIHSSTIKSSFVSRSGRRIPCLIHRFQTPEPRREELVVLNFYVVNGEPSNDESTFSGAAWRTPNVDGNIASYVAQVQINSVIESAVLAFAGDSADIIVSFLPNERGNVAMLHEDGN
jgi:hypothetical protein